MDRALKLLIEKNVEYDIEFRIKKLNDGAERVMHSIAKISFNKDEKPIKVLGVIKDITERRANEELIKHLAYYDVLTDLLNKVLFIDRLTRGISHAK
jgi:hypothetical protein